MPYCSLTFDSWIKYHDNKLKNEKAISLKVFPLISTLHFNSALSYFKSGAKQNIKDSLEML